MAVLIKELEQEIVTPSELAHGLGMLRDQVTRCKRILSSLTESAGQARAESGGRMHLDDYLEEVIMHWRTLRPAAQVVTHWRGTQPAPSLLAELTLRQAITNILNNAADAAPGPVEVDGQWDERELRLEVCDRGPGLVPAVEKNAGTLFFTTKEAGLGLGLFLAHATLNRFGGTVQLFNRTGGGACTRLVLPLGDLLVGD